MNTNKGRLPSSRTKEGAVYLDNAATSWPKPPGVADSMHHFIDEIGANPGRSGHRMSIQAAHVVYSARAAIAELFGVSDPLKVIFGINITDGINLALHGLLKPGDHVVTSSMEHNAVMRPLNDLLQKGVTYTRVPCSLDGTLNPALLEQAIQPNTKIVALNHASNVCGTLLPIHAVGEITRNKGLLYLVDTAQSAGTVPIDMETDYIDMLAFTGHKSLYGPMGTGGIILGSRVDPADLSPIKQGGTGSRSEREVQPEFCPDRYESGTANAVGLAGLLSALEWLKEQGIIAIQSHKETLCAQLIEGLMNINGVTLYGPKKASLQTATIGFNVNGMEPSTVGLRLDEEFNILCRVGLHCAPAAHQTLGTFPHGCVRFGLGVFNASDDIEQALSAVEKLAEEMT